MSLQDKLNSVREEALTNPGEGTSLGQKLAAARASAPTSGDNFTRGHDANDKSQYDSHILPDIDTNELRAAKQTNWDKLGNGLVKMTNTGVGSIIQGLGVVGGLSLYGVAELNEKLTGQGGGGTEDMIFKNPFIEFVAHHQEEIAKSMPHYKSQAEQQLSAIESLGTVNFWSGEFLDGVGFLASAMIPAGIIGKAGNVFKTAVMASRANKIGLLTNLLGDAAAAARFSKVVNATSTLAGAMYGRLGESAIEANEVYDKVLQETGDAQLASDARLKTFGMNMALALPDAYQFGKLFSSFKGTSRAIRGLKASENGIEMAKRSGKKKFFDFAAPVAENIAIESQEENYQLAVSSLAHKIATGQFSEDAMSTVDGALKSIGAEMIGNFTTKEGQTSMILGGLLGGGMGAVTSFNENRQKTKYTKSVIDKYNSVPQSVKEHMVAFTELENTKNQAAENGDRAMYDTAKQLQFNNWVKSKIDAGKFSDLILELEGWANTEMEPGAVETNAIGTPKDAKYIASKAVAEAKRLEKIYSSVQDAFSDQLDQNGINYLFHNLSMQEFLDKKIAKLSLEESEAKAAQKMAEAAGNPFELSLQQLAVAKDLQGMKMAKATLIEEYKNLLNPETRKEALGKLKPETKADTKQTEEKKPTAKTEAKTEAPKTEAQPTTPVADASKDLPSIDPFRDKMGTSGGDASGRQDAPPTPPQDEPDPDKLNAMMGGGMPMGPESAGMGQQVGPDGVPVAPKQPTPPAPVQPAIEDKSKKQGEEARNIHGLLNFAERDIQTKPLETLKDELTEIGNRIIELKKDGAAQIHLDRITKRYEAARDVYVARKNAENIKAAQTPKDTTPAKGDPNFYSKVQTAQLPEDKLKSIELFNDRVRKGESIAETHIKFENNGQFNIYGRIEGDKDFTFLGYLRPLDTSGNPAAQLDNPVNKRALETTNLLKEQAKNAAGKPVVFDHKILSSIDSAAEVKTDKTLADLDARFQIQGNYEVYRVSKPDTESPVVDNVIKNRPATAAIRKDIGESGLTDGYLLRVQDPGGNFRFIGLGTAPMENFDELFAVMNDASLSDKQKTTRLQELAFVATNPRSGHGRFHAKFMYGAKGPYIALYEQGSIKSIGTLNFDASKTPKSMEEFISNISTSNQAKENFNSLREILAENPIRMQIPKGSDQPSILRSLVPSTSEKLWGTVHVNVEAIREATPVQVEPTAPSTTGLKREDLPYSQSNTRTEATRKLLDFIAEKLGVEKYKGDLESGKYISWLQDLGYLGYEVAAKLGMPQAAYDLIANYKIPQASSAPAAPVVEAPLTEYQQRQKLREDKQKELDQAEAEAPMVEGKIDPTKTPPVVGSKFTLSGELPAEVIAVDSDSSGFGMRVRYTDYDGKVKEGGFPSNYWTDSGLASNHTMPGGIPKVKDKLWLSQKINQINYKYEKLEKELEKSLQEPAKVEPTQETPTVAAGIGLKTKEELAAELKAQEEAKKKEEEDADEDVPWKVASSTEFIEDTDWAKASTELARILPEGFSLKNIKELANGIYADGSTWGAFQNKVIYLADKTGKGTLYHEILHAVLRKLVKPTELNRYLQLAAKEVNLSPVAVAKFLEEYPRYKGKKVAEVRRIMVEEHLADKFQQYMNNKPNTVFGKLFDKVKRFFNWVVGRQDELADLFRAIDKGNFKQSAVVNNKMDHEAVFKAISYSTVDESGKIIRRAAGLYLERFRKEVKDKAGQFYNYDKISFEEAMDQVIDEIKEATATSVSRFSGMTPEEAAAAQLATRVYKGEEAAGEDPMKVYKMVYSMEESRQEIVDQVSRLLKSYGFGKSINEAILDEYPEADDTNLDDEDQGEKERDHNASPFEVGGLGNVSKEIKAFIGLTMYDVPGQDLPDAIDLQTTYSQMERVLAGLTSYDDMLTALSKKARSNDSIKAILARLEKMDDLFKIKFQQAFTKEFVQHLHVDYNDKTGAALVYSANRKDVADIQLANYKKRYETSLRQAKNVASIAKTTAGTISAVRDLYAEDVVDQDALKTLTDELLNKLSDLGLEFSPDFLEDVLKDEHDKYTVTDRAALRDFFGEINAIVNIIAKGENPYKDLSVEEEEAESTDAISRIKRLGQEDAQYRSDIVQSSFQNAEGKSVYSYTEPSYVIVKARELQEGKVDLSDKYYERNLLIKNKGLLESLKFFMFNGIREQSADEGVTFKHMDAKTLLVSQHAMFRETKGRQKFIPFVYEAKSSTSAIEVDTRGRFYEGSKKVGNRMSDFAAEQMYDFLMQDLERIKRVEKEIQTLPMEELIEGYHFLGGKPNRNSSLKDSKLPRGLMIRQFPSFKYDEVSDLVGLERAEGVAKAKPLFEQFIEDEIDAYRVTLADNDLPITLDPVTGMPMDDASKRTLAWFTGENWSKGSTAKWSSPKDYLGEFILKDFIMSNSYAQLIRGEEAYYKDHVDVTKRAAALVAAGKPRMDEGPLNVTLLADDLEYIDPTTMERVDKDHPNAKEMNTTDAQGYTSAKNFLNIMKGLGRISKGDEAMIRDLIEGKPIEWNSKKNSDIFVANSIKNVYFDGQIYIKTSIIPLFKEMTSIENKDYDPNMEPSADNAKWVAKPGLEKLHNLREQMDGERYGVRDTSMPEIDEAYHESAFKLVKKSKNFRGENGMYNGLTTQQLDKKYWRLQVENPSGKTKVTYGTQLLQLIDSEMDDNHIVEYQGSAVPLKTVRDEYQNMLAGIKQEGFTKATALLTTMVNDKNVFFDKLQSMLEDSGSDQNTIDFFSQLAGEMVHSPDLPNMNAKYQQLFLAHFNKSVFSQKTTGSKWTLVTAQGYNVLDQETGQYRPLKAHRFENGEFKYAEVIASEEVLVKYGITRKELESGNVPAEVRDEILTMMGFRIPTQSHHSMMPFKIVGWLPAYYGSVVIAPSEIVYLSGADYDVDTLWVNRKAFKVKNGRPSVYSTRKTTKELWEDYLDYEFSENKELKRVFKTLSKSNKELKDLTKKVREIEETAANRLGSMTEFKKLLATLRQDQYEAENTGEEPNRTELENEVLLLGDENVKLVKQLTKLREDIRRQALETMKMISTEDQFSSLPVNDHRRYTDAARYNAILDTGFSFISNPANKDSTFTPASMDSIANISGIVADYKGMADKVSIPYNTARNKFINWQNNAVGKANVGPAALINTASAFLTKYKVPLNQTAIEFDGKIYDTYADNFEYDIDLYKDEKGEWQIREHSMVIDDAGQIVNQSGFIKRRKADSLSTVVSAMTDNAKERHAAKLNLTQQNLSVFANMIGLGMGMNRTMIFANQPVLIEFSKKVAAARTHIGKSRKSYELLEQFIERMGVLIGSDNLPEDTNVTSEEMLAGLKNFKEQSTAFVQYRNEGLGIAVSKKGIANPEHLEMFKFQYKVLLQYKQLSDIAGDVSNVSKVISTNKTVGVDFDSIDKILKAHKSVVHVKPRSEENPGGSAIDIAQALERDVNLKQNIQNLRILDDRLKEYFLSKTTSFKNFMERMDSLGMGLDSFSKLPREYATYLGIKALDAKAAKLGKQLFDNQPLIESKEDAITNRFLDLLGKHPELNDNVFLSQLTPKAATKKKPIATLEYNTRHKSDPSFIEMLVDSYTELSVHPNKEVKKFAADLYVYLLVKDNLGYTNNSFIKLIPASKFKSYSDNLKAVKKVFDLPMGHKGSDERKAFEVAFNSVFGKSQYDLNREFIIKWYSMPSNRDKINRFVSLSKYYKTTSPEVGQSGTTTRTYDFSSAYANPAELDRLLKDASAPFELDADGSVKFPEVFSVTSSEIRLDDMGNELDNTVVWIRQRNRVSKVVNVVDTGGNVEQKQLKVVATYTQLNKYPKAKHSAIYHFPVKDDENGVQIRPVDPKGPTDGDNGGGNTPQTPTTPSQPTQPQAPVAPTNQGPVNIWFGTGENSQLSNLAARPFKDTQGRHYHSVEHAYQSWKSGAFDEATYNKYKSGGQKIVGNKGTKTQNNWNIDAMRIFIRQSFEQNPEAAAALLATGNRPLTHNQDTGIWKDAFPRLLTEIRSELRAAQEKKTQTPVAPIPQPDTAGKVKIILQDGTVKWVAPSNTDIGGTGFAGDPSQLQAIDETSTQEKLTEEAARVLVSKLQNKFSIEAVIINNEELPWKGAYWNGRATINLAHATMDTPFHEFAHPFVSVIKKQNSTLYNNLRREILSEGKILDRVKEKYFDLNEEDQIEEAIVQAIGVYANGYSGYPESLKQAIKRVLQRIAEYIKQLVDNDRIILPSELNPDLTLRDLAVLMNSGNQIKLGDPTVESILRQLVNDEEIEALC